MYIAIDPAQKVSGVAYSGIDAQGERVTGTASINDILDAGEICELLGRLKADCVFETVTVGVEYPFWNAGAAQTVRAAANTFIRLVRRVFDKPLVVRIDPNQWQNFFQYRARGPQSTKSFSLTLVNTVYGWNLENHNEADAALILEYLRSGVSIVEKQRRTNARKLPKKF